MGCIARGRQLAAALLFLASLVAGAAAFGRTAIDFDQNRQHVMLQSAGDAWVDTSGKASVEEVAAATAIRWHPTADDAIYKLDKGEALWIRFTVPATPNTERWYLEIPYPGVDRVTLFVQRSDGQWISSSAGDNVALSDWPFPHRHPIMPLVVSPNMPRVHYLRVQNGTIFGAPLQFVNDSYLARHEQGVSLALGIYFGLVVLTVMLSAAGAVTLKDHGYTLYAVSCIFIALTQATMTGLAGLHLWGDWPWFNNVAPQIVPLLGVASLQLFFAEMVALGPRAAPQ